MNNRLIPIGIIWLMVFGSLGVIIQTSGRVTAEGWAIEAVDSDDAYRSSIAVDSEGNPHIAYYCGQDIRYVSLINNNWR